MGRVGVKARVIEKPELDSRIEKIRKLLVMATRGTQEEARTAAVIAAQMILDHDLLHPAPPPVEPPLPEPRTPDQLRPIIDLLLEVFLAAAWEHRNTDRILRVPDIVDFGIGQKWLTRLERERANCLLSNRLTEERKKGVVVTIRGRYGGYRMAPKVRRFKSKDKAATHRIG